MREFVLSFFLLSGLIKSSLPIFQKSPVDIIIISCLILTVFAFLDYVNGRVKLGKPFVKVVLLYVLLILMAVISLTYTKSATYAFSKTILMAINLIALIIPVFSKNKIDLNKLYFYIICIVVVCSISYDINYFRWRLGGSGLSWDDIRESYLLLSISVGLAFLLNLYREPKGNVIKLSLGFFLIFTLLLSGGRGAIIFLLLTLFFISFKHFISFFLRLQLNTLKLKISQIYSLVFIGVLILIFTMVFIKSDFVLSSFDRTIARLELLISDDKGKSVNERLSNFSFLINNSKQHPLRSIFGNGIGSWGILKTGIDQKAHPHNFLLEIYFELGLFSLAIMFFLLLYVVLRAYRLGFPGFIVFPIIFIFLNSLKSSSLVENRLLFGFIGILFLIEINDNSRSRSKENNS